MQPAARVALAILSLPLLAQALTPAPALALTGNIYGYQQAATCQPGKATCYWGPARIVLTVGDSVTWRNASGVHGVSPLNTLGTRWPANCTSKDIGAAGYSCTFGAAGNYVYWCRRHGQLMTGTIAVVTPGRPTVVAPPSSSPSPSPKTSAAGSNKSGAPDPVMPTLVVLVALVAVFIGVRALRQQRRKRR